MIREFFYLQKSDRKVILTLLLVIVVALTVIFFAGGESDGEDSKDVESREHVYHSAKNNANGPLDTPKKAELFPFDPNTADSTQLLRLGLQSWQVRNIYKYRAAGGIYRQKTDFARLYGLTVKQYRELEPYIRISDDYLPASTHLKALFLRIEETGLGIKGTGRVILFVRIMALSPRFRSIRPNSALVRR